MYLIVCYRKWEGMDPTVFTHQQLSTAKGVMKRILKGSYGPHSMKIYSRVELREITDYKVVERIG